MVTVAGSRSAAAAVVVVPLVVVVVVVVVGSGNRRWAYMCGRSIAMYEPDWAS